MNLKKKSKTLTSLLNFTLCLLISLGILLVVIVSVNLLAVITKNHMLLIFLGEEKARNPMETGLFALIAGLLQNTAIIAGTIITTLHIWKKPISALGLTNLKKEWKDLVVGLLLGFIGITIALICLLVSGSVKITGFTTQYTASIFLCFLGYIAVAFGEEILSRGGLMLALKESHRPGLILSFPSLIFGCLHLGNDGISPLAFINLIGFGLYASYCFYRSGNIWLTIGFHLTWNFVQGNVYGFYVSGTKDYSFANLKIVKETIFTGGEFGPEGGLGVTIALILMFIVTKIYYRNRPASTFMTE